MRANTQAISIDAPPEKVIRFLSDGGNLPRWAVGFAKSVSAADDGWRVTTGGGEVHLRIDRDDSTGVVDFVMAPAPGVEVVAASRVIERGPACEVVFTQFQGPGMTDEMFEKNVQAVGHELRVLKGILEVECPL